IRWHLPPCRLSTDRDHVAFGPLSVDHRRSHAERVQKDPIPRTETAGRLGDRRGTAQASGEYRRGLMATAAEWATSYARQAAADFETFQLIQDLPVPQCHKLQSLQMACEKLVKAHLCGVGTDAVDLRTSHAYVASTLPVVLKHQAVFVNSKGK